MSKGQALDDIGMPYGKPLKKYSEVEQRWLTRLSLAKIARNPYEQMWREWNYAYQTIVLEYATQRRFNPQIAPEYQIRNMFPEKRLSDYHLPVEFAVILRQVADEWANLPVTHWVSLNPDETVRQGQATIFQHTYDFFYDLTDGELETFKTLLAKAIYGTSFEYIYQEFMQYPDFEPDGVDKDGVVKFKKITRTINRTRFKNMDIRRYWNDPNATDIEEAEYGFLAFNYGEDTFKKQFGNTKIYDIEGISAIPAIESYVSIGEARSGNIAKVVQVIRGFDVVNNQIIHLANGKRIDKVTRPIPVPSLGGKPQIPVAVYYNYRADREFYGLGIPFILKPFREIKNKTRNMFFDVMKKVAFNTMVIDPDSDFDEDSYVFGQPFIRALPDEVKAMPVQANLQPAIDLDKQTDQDIIWSTGINFLDTAGANANESATKTAVRKESQVKLVELGLKVNIAGGFKRRALLMKQLIRLHYASGTTTDPNTGKSVPMMIKTKGVKLNRGKGTPGKYKISSEKAPNSFGLFHLGSTDLSNDFDLVLEGGNISMTKELMKARQLEAVGFIVKLPPDPQKVLPYDVNAVVAWAIQWGELPKDMAAGQGGTLQNQTPAEVASKQNLVTQPPNLQNFLQQKQQVQESTLPVRNSRALGETVNRGPVNQISRSDATAVG